MANISPLDPTPTFFVVRPQVYEAATMRRLYPEASAFFSPSSVLETAFATPLEALHAAQDAFTGDTSERIVSWTVHPVKIAHGAYREEASGLGEAAMREVVKTASAGYGAGTALAEKSGVSRQTLHNIIVGHRKISDAVARELGYEPVTMWVKRK